MERGKKQGWIAGLCVLGLLIAGLVPAGSAVNPTDDDAGSGQDAGDVEELAVPIEPGVHEGQLHPPVDRLDWYAVEAEAGQRLTFSVETRDTVTIAYLRGPDSDPRFTIPPGTISLVVPESGTWTVGFKRGWTQAEPSPYRFSVELDDPATSFTQGSFPGGTVMETSWDGVQDVDLTVLTCIRDDPGLRQETSGLMIQASWTRAGYDRSLVGWGYGTTGGLGTSVEAGGIDLDAGSTAPSVTKVRSDDCAGFQVSGEITDGRMRAAVWSTHPGSSTVLTFGADEAVQTRTVHTDEVTVWRGFDDEQRQAQAPGIRISEGASTQQALSEDFVGVFRTYGAGGFAERPDGSRLTVPEGGDSFFLASPSPGDWRLKVNGSASAVVSERPNLAGIQAPDLGLTEPISLTEGPSDCRPSLNCRLTVHP